MKINTHIYNFFARFFKKTRKSSPIKNNKTSIIVTFQKPELMFLQILLSDIFKSNIINFGNMSSTDATTILNYLNSIYYKIREALNDK